MGAASRVRPSRNPQAFACAFALLIAPRVAFASSPYRLQVVRAEGTASCPSAAQIERDVSQRLGRHPFSSSAERGIEVVIERAAERFRAKLYLRIDANEADAARVIESDGADCAELGKAVTLAVALAIAPDLPPEPEPAPPPVAAPCPPLPPPPPPPKRSLHGAASLRALFSPNLLPTDTVGTALAVSLHGDLIGASFGGLFFPESQLHTPAAHLGFGLSAAFASGCLLARSQDPQVWSCIGARVGALHSVVYSPLPLSPGDKFWWAGSTEVGVRQRVLGPVFLEAGVAAVFPFVRHRFQVDAQPSPIYEQGPAVVEGFVGLGLRLD